MSENETLNEKSPAVHKHLEIVQGVIQRMAENNRSCKIWCVTLVSAVLVLVARTGEANHVLIAVAPTALFYLMDAYYLALERRYRRLYDGFVKKLHEGQTAASELYSLTLTGSDWGGFLWAMFKSSSVLPFYLVVFITIMLVRLLIC